MFKMIKKLWSPNTHTHTKKKTKNMFANLKKKKKALKTDNFGSMIKNFSPAKKFSIVFSFFFFLFAEHLT